MMKNNKLGKLLSVGVASALMVTCFAPLAFAESSDLSENVENATMTFKIHVNGSEEKTGTDSEDKNAFVYENGSVKKTIAAGSYLDLVYTASWDDTNGKLLTSFAADAASKDFPADSFELNAKDFKVEDVQADHLQLYVDDETGWETKASTYSATVADLFNLAKKTGTGTAFTAEIYVNVVPGEVPAEKPTDKAASIALKYSVNGGTATVLNQSNETVTSNWKLAEKSKVDGVENTTLENIGVDKTVSIPVINWTGTGDADEISAEVVVSTNGGNELGKKEIPFDGSFKISEIGEVQNYLNQYHAQNNNAIVDDLNVTVTIKLGKDTASLKKVGVEKISTFNQTTAKVVTIDKDGKETVNSTKTFNYKGINGTETAKLENLKTSAAVIIVNYGETLSLPEVVAVDNAGKEIEELTFLNWRIVDTTGKVYLSTNEKANGYILTGNKLVADDIKADNQTPATGKGIVIMPYFELKVEEPAADKITTSPKAATPNDKVQVYVNDTLLTNGKKVPDHDGIKYDTKNPAPVIGAGNKITYAEYMGFKGGAFVDETTGLFAIYADKKNVKGEWYIDTTVNGIVDDIVYKDGVQDTEAYGLEKYKDDGFVYLVANGEVLRDYNGLWISPENVWYYLTKGCCQIPATGIFQNDKDETLFHVFANGKIDKTANGLKLYGDTWYNFVNGGCDTKAPTTVVEQDGAFFYVKAGVVDTTFSGEYEGHTFVNGWAAK